MNEPSIRKPLGVLAITAWIVLWAVLAATLPRPESDWLQILWFAVLGIVWIAPLKPVLRWMEAKRGAHAARRFCRSGRTRPLGRRR